MQVFLQMAVYSNITLSEEGIKGDVKNFARASDELANKFYGFISEINSDSEIKSIRVGGKKPSDFAIGSCAARDRIVSYVAGRHSKYTPFVKWPKLDKGESHKSYTALYNAMQAWCLHEEHRKVIIPVWEFMVKLFLADNQERVTTRVMKEDLKVSFDTLYIDACRRKTIVEKVSKKGSKRSRETTRIATVTPTKPWEYPGIRGCEKDPIREVYHHPWSELAKLRQRWDKYSSVDEVFPALASELQSAVKVCVQDQWKVHDFIHKSLQSRRQASQKASFGEQCAWIKETLNKSPRLNDTIFEPTGTWEFVNLLPDRLRILGSGAEVSRTDLFNVDDVLEDVHAEYPCLYRAVRRYKEENADYIAEKATKSTPDQVLAAAEASALPTYNRFQPLAGADGTGFKIPEGARKGTS